MERFFNEDIVGTFQNDVSACSLRIYGTVYIKCPVVLLRGVLKVVDEVEQALALMGVCGS